MKEQTISNIEVAKTQFEKTETVKGMVRTVFSKSSVDHSAFTAVCNISFIVTAFCSTGRYYTQRTPQPQQKLSRTLFPATQNSFVYEMFNSERSEIL